MKSFVFQDTRPKMKRWAEIGWEGNGRAELITKGSKNREVGGGRSGGKW